MTKPNVRQPPPHCIPPRLRESAYDLHSGPSRFGWHDHPERSDDPSTTSRHELPERHRRAYRRGVSQFLNEQLFVGAVGYYLQQLAGDSGEGATLGDFKSRIAGIGPQLGYLFPIGDKVQGALNAKAYWEFAAENRPEGWNLWLGFAISPTVAKKD